MYPAGSHSSTTSTTTDHDAAAHGFNEHLDYVDAATLPKKSPAVDPSAPPMPTSAVTIEAQLIPPSPSTVVMQRQHGAHYPGPPPHQHMP